MSIYLIMISLTFFCAAELSINNNPQSQQTHTKKTT